MRLFVCRRPRMVLSVLFRVFIMCGTHQLFSKALKTYLFNSVSSKFVIKPKFCRIMFDMKIYNIEYIILYDTLDFFVNIVKIDYAYIIYQ